MSQSSQPYGRWPSPVSPARLASAVRFGGAAWDRNGERLVWLEGRSGKGVLVCRDAPGTKPRQLASDLSVRAQVGYGGGDFALHDGQLFFAVHKDGRLFHSTTERPDHATPITPVGGSAASPVVSPDGRFVAYVHSDEQGADRILVVDVRGEKAPRVLAEGHDFYLHPRWSGDGRRFAFVSWNHPSMPWDCSSLYLGDVVAGEGGLPTLAGLQAIAGGDDCSVFQPEFSGDDELLTYVSDESGFGHLWRYHLPTGERRQITDGECEYGLPAWVQEMRSYALSANGRQAICARNRAGVVGMVTVDLDSGEVRPLDSLRAYSDVDFICAAPRGEGIAIIGSSSCVPPRLVVCDRLAGEAEVVARAVEEEPPPASLVAAEAIVWESARGQRAHGLYYAPPAGPVEERPPLVVLVHGGPTAQARAGFSAQAQFFASRGWAVLQPNYRGSTGYGRAYMRQLDGAWGASDVEDVVSGVRHLVAEGAVDPERVAVMGGSAGGFTVYMALIEAPELFAAGVSLYGVSDLFALVRDTHKFEKHYLDRIVGPLPQAEAIYRERSPLLRATEIRRPLALFQGDEDRAVPKGQSDDLVAALAAQEVPHIYHVYQGEGHGFRKAETLEHLWQAVEAFLGRWVLAAD